MHRRSFFTTLSSQIETLGDGFLRLNAIIAPNGPLPISRSSWWAGVKIGRYPQPVKLGPRITAWRVSEIRELIDSFKGEVA